MRISITGKNLEISDYLRDLVDKKVTKLERYFPQNTEAQVTLSVEKNRHIVEVTIPYDGGVIRGEEVTGDMYASIDQVMDKLEKQIEKHKTKLIKRFRGSGFRADIASTVTVPEAEEETIVRTKRFAVKPMDAEEAILQMNMLNHDFFMFLNIETEQVNLVYRRKDGHFGLLEPEF